MPTSTQKTTEAMTNRAFCSPEMSQSHFAFAAAFGVGGTFEEWDSHLQHVEAAAWSPERPAVANPPLALSLRALLVCISARVCVCPYLPRANLTVL